MENKNQELLRKQTKFDEELKEKDKSISTMQQENNKLKKDADDLTENARLANEKKNVAEQKAREMDVSLHKAVKEKDQLAEAFSQEEREKEALNSKLADVSIKLDQSQQALHDLTKKTQTMERDFQEQVFVVVYQ